MMCPLPLRRNGPPGTACSDMACSSSLCRASSLSAGSRGTGNGSWMAAVLPCAACRTRGQRSRVRTTELHCETRKDLNKTWSTVLQNHSQVRTSSVRTSNTQHTEACVQSARPPTDLKLLTEHLHQHRRGHRRRIAILLEHKLGHTLLREAQKGDGKRSGPRVGFGCSLPLPGRPSMQSYG